MLVGGPSWAATIQPVQGDLFINHGAGFQPITAPMDGNVGDSVMVNPGGTAIIAYADGCKETVRPGEVTTIPPTSPCSNPFAHDESMAQSGPGGSDYTNVWIGTGVGLGLAGIGVAIYALTKSKSDTTNVIGVTCGSAANPCYTKVSP